MRSDPIEVAPWGDRLKSQSRSPNRSAAVLQALWLFCRRKPLGALGGLIVLVLLLLALFAPWIAPYSYDETIPGARMKAPGAQFWMGTDNLGRDVFSRVVYGAGVSVTVGFGAVLLANVFATLIGITSGYFGGAYDICVQRVVDAWQSFPFLVVILSMMAVLGPGLLNLVLALGVLGAAAGSRVIRGTTISVMQNTYVEAARALGAGHLRIMLRYVLPNVAATIIILATIGLGAAILAESALSFLGFGVPPPYPSWGAMLSGSGRSFMYRAPWMAIWPGAAISLAVFGFNMLGDALRDVLDPRLRGGGGRPGS
ncbi:MAG TPA: ABC transporter permease [Candidatus Dormibacteraeota bacterium]|nr:ABC transporter permease [Candidatus Dormibacteraeota bacterium]